MSTLAFVLLSMWSMQELQADYVVFNQYVGFTRSDFELHHKVLLSLSNATVIPLTVNATA